MMGLCVQCKFCSVVLLCVTLVVCQAKSTDVDTSACYSSSTRCGQHSMVCPVDHTVIITDARYGHKSRSTPCSRGKVNSCSDRYISTCCRATGDECYQPYDDQDADFLLQSCLGSRTCFHMTPQIYKKCAKYKLLSSTLSVVTHRCVPNVHILGYNTKTQVINDEIYLQYRIPERKPKRGTANVYGCDVIEPKGVKVKVKALNVGMVSVNGRQCSSLEIKKGRRISSYSCGRTDLRFRLTLSEEIIPFEVNIVEVYKSPPQTAWTLLSGGNITVECGKIRPSRRVVEPTTTSQNDGGGRPTIAPVQHTSTSSQQTTGPDDNIQQTDSPTTTADIIETTETDLIEVTSSMPEETTEGPGDTTTPQASVERPVLQSTPHSTTAANVRDGIAASVSSDSGTSSESSNGRENADDSEASSHTEESVPVVGEGEDNYRALTYSGIAGGLLLLIILIIIITVICYRRKRYRLYQSRKIEEKRNIPDGAERSHEKEESDKDANSEDKPKGRVSSPSFSSSSSPPRVSQPRDYDGYTDPDKKKGEAGTEKTERNVTGIDNAGRNVTGIDNAGRNVTVEFFDNPGFKTTIDYIKPVD